jgi:hypothetical protein
MAITPLPRTDRRRREHFNPDMITVSKHHKVQLQPKAKIIRAMAIKKGGINRILYTRAKKGLKKIEGMYANKRTLREIRIMQALFLDEIVAASADHAVEGCKKVGTLEKIAEIEGVKYSNQIELEKGVWEAMFASSIKNFRRALPQAPDVIRMIQYIRRFTKLPLGIHFEREKHWKAINKIEAELLRDKVNPEENLKTEVQRVMKRNMNVDVKDYKKLARLRALDITVASTIYADLLMKTKGDRIVDKIAREQFWNDAYSEGMEKIYPLVAHNEDVLRAIIEYNRESPKGKTPLPRIAK